MLFRCILLEIVIFFSFCKIKFEHVIQFLLHLIQMIIECENGIVLFFFFSMVSVWSEWVVFEKVPTLTRRKKERKCSFFGSPVNRVKARRPRFLLTLLFKVAFILPWRFVSRTQFYLHTHTNILSPSVIIFCTLFLYGSFLVFELGL